MQQPSNFVQPSVNWQACAVDAYQRTVEAQGAALAAALAAQLRNLTGAHIPVERIEVHHDGSYATARFDNHVFRRYSRGLVLVHPGAAEAESPVIETQADLGYALAVWRPLQEPADDNATGDLGD